MKCYYCNKPTANGTVRVHDGLGNQTVDLPYCSEFCKEQLKKYGEYAKKYTEKLLVLVFGIIFLAMCLVLLAPEFYPGGNIVPYIITAALALLGTITLIAPYPLPITKQIPDINGRWGAKKAIILYRIAGVGFILSAILLILLQFFSELAV